MNITISKSVIRVSYKAMSMKLMVDGTSVCIKEYGNRTNIFITYLKGVSMDNDSKTPHSIREFKVHESPVFGIYSNLIITSLYSLTRVSFRVN